MTSVDTIFAEREVSRPRESGGSSSPPGSHGSSSPCSCSSGTTRPSTSISYLFGVVTLVCGMNEFFQITVSTTGWKIVHGTLGVLFVIGGICALMHP